MSDAENTALVERLDFYSMPEPNSGCQLWTGSTTDGYGRLRWRGKPRKAHRLSWEAHYGPVPDGQLVCHKCDVPSCINPLHLWLGTNDDNMADMARKGRVVAARGEQNKRSKLTAEQVVAIRIAAGSQREIARQYGISQPQVGHIKRGQQWRHLLSGGPQ